MVDNSKEEKFLKELGEIMDKFYKEIHTPLVNLVNEYKENEDTRDLYYFTYQGNFKKLDDMALLTAWVTDRIDDRKAFPESKTYRGSLTKKIRKALGYNL